MRFDAPRVWIEYLTTGQDQDGCADAAGVTQTSPFGHRVLFLVFACLAFALFAPTIILPILKQYCETLEEEVRLVRQNRDLEREVRRREALIEAFKDDATINERLAVLDLNYRKPDEEVLTILPPGQAPAAPVERPVTTAQSALHIPADWPREVREAEAWAQQQGLIDLFLDPSLRPAFLFMSGGLIVAAFVLFAPRARHGKRIGLPSESPVQPAVIDSSAV